MKMKALLIFFAVTTSVYASNKENAEVEPITVFHKIWDDLDSDPKYTDKFSTYFAKYDKLYCDPAKIEDSKIEAASKCDPSINFPIAHECADKVYKAKKIKTWNERRKAECSDDPKFDDVDREINNCILKEIKAKNFKIPEPIPPEEVKTLKRDQLAKKVFSIVGNMQKCLEKSLA